MNLDQTVRSILDSGLTQEEIARRAGVTQATISRILNGRVVDVRASTADAIRRVASRRKRAR